jgi:hypothetical protein
MEFIFPVVWCCMGYAFKGKRVVGEFERTTGTPSALEVWRLAPLCLMWCIWRERNARSFKDH